MIFVEGRVADTAFSGDQRPAHSFYYAPIVKAWRLAWVTFLQHGLDGIEIQAAPRYRISFLVRVGLIILRIVYKHPAIFIHRPDHELLVKLTLLPWDCVQSRTRPLG